jgi:hypothetical protein
VQGRQGPQGTQGIQGVQGLQGQQGLQGRQGTQGLQGLQGVGTFYTFSALPPSSPGIGDRWADSVGGAEYTWTYDGNSYQWVELEAIGYQGFTGAQGTQGTTGTQGAQGLQGFGYAQLQGTQGLQGLQGTTGFTGIQGLSGNDGVNGGASIDFFYSTLTGNSDPGSGYFRFNASNLASATSLYISKVDHHGVNIFGFLETLISSSSGVRGIFSVRDEFNESAYVMYSITGIYVSHPNYIEIPVTYLSGANTFSYNQDFILTFSLTGDKGDQGLQGIQGIQGISGAGGVVTTSAGLTMSSNNDYFITALTAPITLSLPSAPSLGDEISIFDSEGTVGSNNVTISPNGGKIMGSTSSISLIVNFTSAELTYTGSTYGWRVTFNGN